jgi:hypothetical protein
MPANGPNVLNDLVIRRLCDALKRGNTRLNACAIARVNINTFNLWCRKAREGHPDYLDFALKIRDAEAYAEDVAIDAIKFGQYGWQGAAWWLQRRNRAKWGEVAKTGSAMLRNSEAEKLEDVSLEDLQEAIEAAAELKRGELSKKKVG